MINILLHGYNLLKYNQSTEMQEDDNSCYSNDEEYFLDICRAGELEELKQFISSLPSEPVFDWGCITNSKDNFLHMLAANNLVEIFDYLFPIVSKVLTNASLSELINRQNSTGNTPLHYAVITNSKEMVIKLLEIDADTSILNESNRTPFAEAEEFDKFQIAEILAPLTKADVTELKKQLELLNVCHEDDDEDEEGQIEEKAEQSREINEE